MNLLVAQTALRGNPLFNADPATLLQEMYFEVGYLWEVGFLCTPSLLPPTSDSQKLQPLCITLSSLRKMSPQTSFLFHFRHKTKNKGCWVFLLLGMSEFCGWFFTV